MIKAGAAAAIAVFSAIGLAAPVWAQSAATGPGWSTSAGSIAAPAGRPTGQFHGRFRSNSSAFGLPAWSSLGRGDFAFFHDRRPGQGDRPDRPHHRRHWRGYGYPFFYGYSAGIDALIPPDLGYFATGGEAWRGSSGHVHYDYDRGYPYDYYRPREQQEAARQAASRERYCETQWTRGRSGEHVPVTVCRN